MGNKIKDWVRAKLPIAYRGKEDIGINYRISDDGRTATATSERGREYVCHHAETEEEMGWWLLVRACEYIGWEYAKPKFIKWRYVEDHFENGQPKYIEYRNYDYNTIRDQRLYPFEESLRVMQTCLPLGMWEKEATRLLGLLNTRFDIPHWGYDRENLRFIEISDSKETVRPEDVLYVVG